MNDLVSLIIAYETGELSGPDTLRLFAQLVTTGQAWTLQGHYGRTAQALIDGGHLIEDTPGEWIANPETIRQLNAPEN